MDPKTKAPGGGPGASLSSRSGRAPERAQHATSAAPSQPPHIVAPHNDYAGIEVTLSRDWNRLLIGVVTRQRDQWVAGGPAPSIPATMIDTAINALIQMRDQLARGGR